MEMSVQQALEQLVEKGHVEFGGMRFTTNLATNMGSFWVKGESGKEGPFEELITHVWDFANSVYCELTDHDVARVSLDCDYNIYLHKFSVTARVTHAMS